MLNIVGIDIGGTFTDFVLYHHQTGKIELWKEPTTPEDPIQAVIDGLQRVYKLNPGDKIRLGTTIATNALLTRNGAKVGYITTRGFRDIHSYSVVTGAVTTILAGSRRSLLWKGGIATR